MNKYLALSTTTALFSAFFFITGCSSSDSGTTSVPANAVVIDNTNAVRIVQEAIESGDNPTETLELIAVETTQMLNLYKVLDIIKPLLTNTQTIDVATGIDISKEITCDNDDGTGTLSVTGTEITAEDGTTTTSGTASFINCTFNETNGSGTLDGSLSFLFSDNEITGDYTLSVSGSITTSISINNDLIILNALDNGLLSNTPSINGTFSFSGFVFSETGNSIDNTYSINEMTYAIDFVIDGTQGGGYLVTLNAPIAESRRATLFRDDCHESGHILITGANGSTAEGIFNNMDTVTVKANGEIIEPAYPYCAFN